MQCIGKCQYPVAWHLDLKVRICTLLLSASQMKSWQSHRPPPVLGFSCSIPTPFLLLCVLLMVIFVYNYYYSIINIIYFKIWILTLERRMLSSPLSASPAIFTGCGSFIVGRDGTLCTSYTYAAGGGGVNGPFGNYRCQALHAEPSYPVPQIEGNNQTTIKQQNHKVGLMVGFCFRGKWGRGSVKGFCFWAVSVATSTWGRVLRPGPHMPPHTHNTLTDSCVTVPPRCGAAGWAFGLGRLSGNLRLGEGFEMGPLWSTFGEKEPRGEAWGGTECWG